MLIQHNSLKHIMGEIYVNSLNFAWKELFCTLYMQINPVKRIILDSKSEMCKWFMFKRLFPAHFCSGLFQYEKRYVLYYAN